MQVGPSSVPLPQRVRKLKKVQAKKIVKSYKEKIKNKKILYFPFLAVLNFFPSSKIDFLAIFEITNNRIWPKKNFVK